MKLNIQKIGYHALVVVDFICLSFLICVQHFLRMADVAVDSIVDEKQFYMQSFLQDYQMFLMILLTILTIFFSLFLHQKQFVKSAFLLTLIPIGLCLLIL
ncbi:MAG: hypothetical protein IJY58_02590 [Alphaproteobacteria bacterium]|nr:hypothetical protein [Alphaproteobacteria bacterium]MBQ9089916.1 hypothetical protein [Alphaproteobacteria bacterium]